MKENIIRMALDAGMEHREHADEVNSEYCDGVHLDDLERFAALVAAAERNKLIAWMMAQGYTYDIERDKLNEWMGYTASQGDATKDLLTELGWQIEQRIKGLMSDMECQVVDRVKAEREACAAIARQWDADHPASNYGGCIANLIEARGQA